MNPDASPLTSNFEVYVSKDTFKFNAAHFVAFQGYRERLHGHNYQVGVRLLGRRTLGADGYVIDYGNIKAVCKTVCKKLNEHFLCPIYSNVLTIQESDDNTQTNIHIECQDGSSFSFPKQDCAMLPIVHATTEEIAIYLWSEILKGLNAQYLVQRGIHTMEVTVAEAPGQQATFRWEIPEQMEEKFSLDVRTFLQTGEVVPMPCLEQDEKSKIKSTCCDGCQNNFATQLERLAKAINERTTAEAMTPEELQNMLNHNLS